MGRHPRVLNTRRAVCVRHDAAVHEAEIGQEATNMNSNIDSGFVLGGSPLDGACNFSEDPWAPI